MAPKKKDQQKMSLGDFLTDSGFGGGSWADEVEETYVTGTQQLPPSDRPRLGGGSSTWQDRGYSVRESNFPQTLPDKPPYTAHLGNLSYDATSETVTEFFEGCDVASVRIIEDRELQRPKGFGYVEFAHVDGLKKALTLDGESFQGRMIKIKIAEPPRGGGGDPGRGDSIRELGNWTRKGPLEDAPNRGPRQQSDFGERRGSRDPAAESKPARDFTWERRGPLAPLAQEENAPDAGRQRPAPEGLGERSESYRGNRRQSPATWGEGRPEGSRPPRRDGAERQERPERPERPERAPTAADKDMQWRDRMRPDAAAKSPEPAEVASPTSPTGPAPGGRPRLNLQKRTVAESDALSPSAGSDSKASPFGAARPIDTATREKQVEEKREQVLREKREADEKAKEERRLAKEAAAQEAQEAQEAEEKAKESASEIQQEEEKKEEGAAEVSEQDQNGAIKETKVPVRTREPRESKDGQTTPKTRA
ncbi:unnamed protein product, partial [Clonostachys rosea]